MSSIDLTASDDEGEGSNTKQRHTEPVISAWVDNIDGESLRQVMQVVEHAEASSNSQSNRTTSLSYPPFPGSFDPASFLADPTAFSDIATAANTANVVSTTAPPATTSQHADSDVIVLSDSD